jgi:hypothetical protein
MRRNGMPDIRVHIHTQGGASHPIEAPTDIKTEEFIKELIAGLDLPKVDAEGHPVSWTIDDKDTGRTLDYQSTLAEAGVANGHQLYMRRQVTAGCRGAFHRD